MTAANLAIADEETLSKAYPQGVRWNIDIPHVDLVHVLDEAIVKFHDRPAMDFFGKKITYQELGSLVSRAAKGLQDMGVGKGSKVGMFMPNTPFYPVMFFAALRVGATIVNFNSMFTKDELRSQIENSGTTIMVTTDLKDFHDKAAELQKEGALKQIIRCDMADAMPLKWTIPFLIAKREERTKSEEGRRNLGSYLIDQLARKAPKKAPGGREWDPLKGQRSSAPIINFKDVILNDGYYRTTALEADDIAVLQYTGGTSGIPKGAMLSHFNLVANAFQIEEVFCHSDDKPADARVMNHGSERIIAALPYFHVFGMTVSMISAFRMGAEIFIIPNPRDVPHVMKTISNSKITIFPTVPRLLQAILENPKGSTYDFSNLDMTISGGAAITLNVRDAFEKLVGKKDGIRPGYGLSEASPLVSATPPYGQNSKRSVGIPCPRTEVKIVDIDNPDKILNIDETGEILVRGPQIMQGYYNRPDETEKTLQNGWLHTGDIGKLDKHFNLHITDRLKRMININGQNVYPSEVEKHINEHPAVAECVIIGLPDSRSGEAAKAFIRLKEGHDSSSMEKNIRDFLATKINHWDIPKFITFDADNLPRTVKGELNWKLLQDRERARLAQINNDSSTPKPN